MKVLLLGAGRSGVGAAKVLAQKHEVCLVNETAFPEMESLEEAGVRVKIKAFKDLDLSWADRVFKAPGIAFETDTVKFYNEIELAAFFAPDYRLYAITGSNGKTTTTRLLEHIFQSEQAEAFAAGNIGYALSQAIWDKGNADYRVALEISAFQLEGLEKVRFPYSAILNLSPDHLDRYQTKENYYAAKLKLFDYSEYVLVNVDDENLKAYAHQEKSIGLSLKGKSDIYLKDQTLYLFDGAKISFQGWKLRAEHNLYNAAFAASLAYFAGIPIKKIESSLKTFRGVEHRLEYLGTVDGVEYYNDSKATNPEASLAALRSFDDAVLLLAGGKDEGNDFSILAKESDRVKKAYLFGESAEVMAPYFEKAEIFRNLEEAFEAVKLEMQAEDVVLLSPACASYDQYKNFEERGAAFKKLIKTR